MKKLRLYLDTSVFGGVYDNEFKEAVYLRNPSQGLIVHSDRGIQYASKGFRECLSKHACVQSMSRKGNCWDNAVAESFFGSLKKRLIYHRKYETMEELRKDLFQYIEVYYYTFFQAGSGTNPNKKVLIWRKKT